MSEHQDTTEFRSGFISFVGRPNAGKSTLTNALVGQKIAIASSKPQTTRHAVRGILTLPDAQLVLIDTPGLHKPRTLLGERLNDLVRTTWAEVDTIGVCLPANEAIGRGDDYLVGEIAKLPHRPKLLAVMTKTDLVSPNRLAEQLQSVIGLEERHGVRFEHIVPVSALEGAQLGELVQVLVEMAEPGPKFFPDEEVTDEPTEVLVAELIREAALECVRDELPHSIAVQIDEMAMREGRPEDRPLLDIFASMIVERDSQKGIIIGHQGSHLRDVGTRARQQISALLGTPVHLDLKVKVMPDWQRNPKYLNRLGF